MINIAANTDIRINEKAHIINAKEVIFIPNVKECVYQIFKEWILSNERHMFRQHVAGDIRFRICYDDKDYSLSCLNDCPSKAFIDFKKEWDRYLSLIILW